ncbi:MAG: pyruvate, phosphate dikinase [Bacteroidetes bacterium]|nr:pyruvate, phosphate dikinase [Bacteroidota bacterium]
MIEKKRLLQSYLNRDSKHRDIFHDMMPYKVREILLISNLYDAFFIEREGRFSEIMLYEYGQMNISSAPRITGATFIDEALEILDRKKINLVIIMVGLDKTTPMKISNAIRKKHPRKTIFMLLNNNIHVKFFQQNFIRKSSFNQVFVWNGESKIFFAMIKYLEDMKNAKRDTLIASVRLILIVEDSPVFYSAYLSNLYQIVYSQTNEIINEISTDKLYKVLKLRIRPKLLLASNYEEAMRLYQEYKDFIFCLITDVQFEKAKEMNDQAGFELVKEIRKIKNNLPTIILSSDKSKASFANEIGVSFLDKNEQDLYKNLKYHVNQKIGFGKFLFKDKNEKIVAKAKTIRDFEKSLFEVSDESIMFHAENNHFSLWLMARAEIQLAKVLIRKKASEFNNADEIRNYLLETVREYRVEEPSGKVVPFSEAACGNEENIVSLAEGSFGGKGRGLAFINSVKYRFDLEEELEGINIRIPKTAVVGIVEFEDFIENNEFTTFRKKTPEYEEVKRQFLEAPLSEELNQRLLILLDHYKKPLAIRSSGLFEDSISQPFAGIFETYVLPNNHPDKEVKLKQLTDAIKLVFASVFTKKAINYIKALNQKLGEEKMAVIIQELVGNEHEGVYYPHISGVAQSYNYYPFAHMKPEEGFVVAAIGLGTYVVEGEVAFRFSPAYPKSQFLMLEDQVKYTQTHFYAVDMTHSDLNLVDGTMTNLKRMEVYDARTHGTLTHCISEFNYNNNAIYPGWSGEGPMVVNFASVLKNEYIPLASTIKEILNLFENAFGTPVEIEFAVDLNLDDEGEASFYILQVKPLIRPKEDFTLDMDEVEEQDMILFAEKAMGNGAIDYLSDVIFTKNEVFDKLKTEEMAKEMEKINKRMTNERLEYILIGEGRWGTRDRFVGIPVDWTQISSAKVIVETELEGFPLDASYGSHFFHNLTTMNIAYFSVYNDHGRSTLNYDILNSAELIEETKYFKHVRFQKPLEVKIDGKKRIAVICKT